jgi:tetratricopeptide (TPR) repeat protein
MIETLGAMRENEEIRDELNDLLRIHHDYIYGLNQTKLFLHYLKETKGCDSDFNFAYYMMALFYRRLEKHKYAIVNLQKAKLYKVEEAEEIKNKQLLGQLYHELNGEKNIKKAITLYKECIEYYKKRKLYYAYAGLLCNIGDALHDEILIKKSIKIYKKSQLKDANDRDDVLQEMYRLLDNTITYNKKNSK